MATSSESFEALGITQYQGVYMIVLTCYALAVAARCFLRHKFNAKAREATIKRGQASTQKPGLELAA